MKSESTAGEKIILALDVSTSREALEWIGRLQGYVRWVKIGMQLFSSEGPPILEAIKQTQVNIFLDMKYHDIPNTVAQTARVLVRSGIQMFNVHAAGGREMMARTAEAVAAEAAKLNCNRPKILAVTVLTSMSEPEWRQDVGGIRSIEEQVCFWAKAAQECGLDGVVASPQEIAAVRKTCGPDFMIVTPGVRMAGGALHDQKRILTPAAAMAQGASLLVMGRPILEAPDPVATWEQIVKSLAN